MSGSGPPADLRRDARRTGSTAYKVFRSRYVDYAFTAILDVTAPPATDVGALGNADNYFYIVIAH